VIHLDTSALIGALSRTGRHEGTLRQIVDAGERTQISTPVLYEWLRGPRTSEEIAAQRALFPDETAVGFGPAEARLAAELYRNRRRPRSRAADLAVAACALVQGATLWTLDPQDFADVPGLALYRERR
jgi:predicted nucleic acid-binding protein